MGAGDVGSAMAVALNGAGVSDITVANRSPERGAELAARVGGRAIGLDGVIDSLVETDGLLAATGASDVLRRRGWIEAATATRCCRAPVSAHRDPPRHQG